MRTGRALRTRASLALALVITLCAALAGCGGDGASSEGGKVTLRFAWWGNPDRAERTDAAIALFEKQHPDITISGSYAGSEPYKQKLATQAAGGDAPDVMQLDYRQINQYAHAGVLLDLGTRSEVRPGDIDRGLLATGAVDGKQYAIPMGRGLETMAYDATLWHTAGMSPPAKDWTWGDWADAMRKLSEAGIDRTGGTDPGQSEDQFEVWLRGQGKALYTDHGQLGFTADDLTRWWTWTTGLRKAGVVSTAEETTQLTGSVEDTPLGRGRVVSDFNWDSPVSGYQDLVGEGLTLGPMPVGEDGTYGAYFKPSMFIAAAANTEHPVAAAQFTDFMVNDVAAGTILGATRGIPVNDTVRQQVVPDLEGFDKVISDYQARYEGRLAAPPPAPPKGDTSLQTTFQRDYDQVSFEQLTPREAAESYLTEANAELKQ